MSPFAIGAAVHIAVMYMMKFFAISKYLLKIFA